MKIGFFCNEYPPRPHGGIGTFVRTLAEALVGLGHTVTVVEFGPRAQTRTHQGVRIVTLRESRTRRLAWIVNRLRLWHWLRRAVTKGEIEIFEIPDFQGPLPFPSEPCQTVVRLHHAESHIREVMNGTGRKTKIYWLEKATLRFHRRWIGVSHYILEASKNFYGCAPQTEAVIYNPAPWIEPDRLPELRDRPRRYILFVGSISERKGALVLAQAVAPLLAQWPDLHLVYVGPETSYEGAPISRAVFRIVGEFLAPRVRFLGAQPHEVAMAWMRGALAVALPSKIEALPIVVLEAMQFGVPVVYTRSGPGPELITDGVDGLLVDPDNPRALRSAIERLVEDPGYARRLGEAARVRVNERFKLERCVGETLRFYQNLHHQR